MQKDKNSPPQFHFVTPDENNGDNNNMQTAKKRGKWTLKREEELLKQYAAIKLFAIKKCGVERAWL
jgi:hypothetical protein